MDTFKFDSVARLFGSGMTRRGALYSLVAGTAAVTAGGDFLASEETAAAKPKAKTKKAAAKKPAAEAPAGPDRAAGARAPQPAAFPSSLASPAAVPGASRCPPPRGPAPVRTLGRRLPAMGPTPPAYEAVSADAGRQS